MYEPDRRCGVRARHDRMLQDGEVRFGRELAVVRARRQHDAGRVRDRQFGGAKESALVHVLTQHRSDRHR
jgi:hypothetical protein